MALSLGSSQVKLTVHSKTQLDTTPFYSTPRRFNNSIQVENDMSPKVLSGIARDQMAPLLLPSSNFEHDIAQQHGPHKVASSWVISDLPSWTPLRVLEDDEGSSTFNEVDESSGLLSRKTNQARRPNTLGHDPLELQTVAPVISTSILGPPKRDNLKKKKARFDGVVIVSKYRHPVPASRASQLRAVPPREGASESNALSLVDALKRTFDANKHADVSPHRAPTLPRRLDRLCTTQEQDTDASTGTTPGPPTDVEVGSTTEPDDERPQLNNRLLAPRTPKRHLTRAARAVARSESNNDSERDASVRPERPAKRLKPIPYDAYAAFVDRALGTVQAPITWDAEPDFITNDALVVRQPPGPLEPTFADVPMDIDREMQGATPVQGPGEGFKARLSTDTVAGNAWHTPALRLPQKAVFSPRIPRGDRFKECLVTAFGENATVRIDKAARPKPAAFDLFAPLDELDRAPSQNSSESSVVGTPPSRAKVVMNTVISTHFTSPSPKLPPTTFPSASHGISESDSLNEVGPARGKAAFDTHEEQISDWITALQRLIKGKVHVSDRDLEKLSIVLAEIESVKDSLDARGLMTIELHEALKRLSELQEVPFGDRNKLRRRAGTILLGWPTSAPQAG